MAEAADFIVGSDRYLLVQLTGGDAFRGFGDLPNRAGDHPGNQRRGENKQQCCNHRPGDNAPDLAVYGGVNRGERESNPRNTDCLPLIFN